ncbi:hypothetical protein GGI35DRAFT_463039 [Trichoderma velutinum]
MPVQSANVTQMPQSSLPDSHAMKNITALILKNLTAVRKLTNQQPPEIFQVTFKTDCNPVAFAKQEGYDESAAEALPKIITLTGSLSNAQCLTIEDYLSQTWPTTGCNVLQSIQRVLQPGSPSAQMPVKCGFLRGIEIIRRRIMKTLDTAESQTELTVFLENDEITIRVLGTAHDIAKIGEQMGWLATTLSLSTQEERKSISCRYPMISSFQADSPSPSSSTAPAFICEIRVITESTGEESLNLSHYGWYNQFNGQIITTGYPIKPRGSFGSGSGIEIRWEIMVALGLSLGQNERYWLTNFDTYSCVKEYSRMLIPIRNENNIISWHLLMKPKGERLSYNQHHAKQAILLGDYKKLPKIVRSKRHILIAVLQLAEEPERKGKPESKGGYPSTGV